MKLKGKEKTHAPGRSCFITFRIAPLVFAIRRAGGGSVHLPSPNMGMFKPLERGTVGTPNTLPDSQVLILICLHLSSKGTIQSLPSSPLRAETSQQKPTEKAKKPESCCRKIVAREGQYFFYGTERPRKRRRKHGSGKRRRLAGRQVQAGRKGYSCVGQGEFYGVSANRKGGRASDDMLSRPSFA